MDSGRMKEKFVDEINVFLLTSLRERDQSRVNFGQQENLSVSGITVRWISGKGCPVSL